MNLSVVDHPQQSWGQLDKTAFNDTIRGDSVNYIEHLNNLSVNGFRAYSNHGHRDVKP